MARSLNAQVDEWLQKVERSVSDYSKKDRRKILLKAARPVVRKMRAIAPRSMRPHYRYPKGGQRIQYNPGNLRRSIKRLPLRRTQDAYVGPQFARKRALEYGGPGQPTDAYYAAMIYGSARAFRQRVIDPAAQAAESEVIRAVRQASRDAIQQRAKARGLATG